MPDLNKIKDDANTLTKKIRTDLETLGKIYSDFNSEVESRFKDEFREQKGKIDGLEDFYSLKLIVNRNSQSINNALGIISKLKNISDFNISEMSEKLEEKKIKELIK